ncbi:MAG: alanine dehydrogenase [Dethiobacter sp.]|jgi:alanine dehydrogenase|nr:alanine dehydrogenase [Dethiobacter sp.]MCL5994113.1 alanine dehydrogenase [Bacillota bacterium]
MIIGVPKEIKMDEMRVSVVPSGVEELVSAGHRVLVERSAGVGAGFSDQAYEQAGAELMVDGQAVWGQAELVVKVKEPLPVEYGLMRAEQIIFTFLHLAAVPELAAALASKKAVAVAYETIQQADRSLPLLEPMSEIAGKMSIQVGARLLEKTSGGRGVLLGGVPGVPPADVVIIGAGTVGQNAARIALGMGAQVSMLDLSVQRMRAVYDLFAGRVITSISNSYNIAKAVRHADLLVGAALIPGAKAPQLVSEELVKKMKAGAVIIDVAIDQGGIIETIDRITTHSSPTYVKHGVLHYAVPNMPGAVPRTSTFALTNVTFPYLLQLANKGYKQAFAENPVLAAGANIACGYYTHSDVAHALGQVYTPLSRCI